MQRYSGIENFSFRYCDGVLIVRKSQRNVNSFEVFPVFQLIVVPSS